MGNGVPDHPATTASSPEPPAAATAGGAEPLVRVRGLHFSRGDTVVFDDVDMDIPRGAVTAIMGPSGTGKTTLLKLISGQLRPQAGSIEVDGLDVHRLGLQDLYRLRTRMGMLFQSGALLDDLTVFENVAFPLREHGRLPPSLLRRLVLMKLQAVGLRGAADLLPAQLSGGMARRAALARAIALDPMMVMYDEPFTGQDPISMGVLVSLVHQLNDAGGLSSIIVSHDVPETLGIADHVYVIASGRILCSGPPAAVSTHADPRVRQFLDGAPDGPVHFHYPAAPLAEELLAVGRRRRW